MSNNTRDVKSLNKLSDNSFRVILTDPLDPSERQTTPIPVEFNLNENVFNSYSEALAVAAGAQVDILTYVVPSGFSLFLALVSVSGDNIAEYTVIVDGSPIDKVRTWWGKFNANLEFSGLKLETGTEIKIRVNNYRDSSADFNAKINGVLRE